MNNGVEFFGRFSSNIRGSLSGAFGKIILACGNASWRVWFVVVVDESKAAAIFFAEDPRSCRGDEGSLVFFERLID